MNIRKSIATAITAVVVGGGLALTSVLPASATECVPSEEVPAWTEVVPDIEHPAVGEPTITVENPDYVPAVEYQPAVYGERPLITPAVEYQAAVYATEYEFRHKLLVWKTKWSEDPNWNAEDNEHSLGWYATGNTRQGRLISAEVPAQEAVYGEAPLLSPEVPAQPAVGEPTITIPNPDHGPAYTEVTPDIEHPAIPAVVCEEEPVEEPVVPVEPTEPEQPVAQPVAVQPVAARVAAPTSGSEQLAETGAGPVLPLALGGGLLAALGAGSLLLARKRQVS